MSRDTYAGDPTPAYVYQLFRACRPKILDPIKPVDLNSVGCHPYIDSTGLSVREMTLITDTGRLDIASPLRDYTEPSEHVIYIVQNRTLLLVLCETSSIPIQFRKSHVIDNQWTLELDIRIELIIEHYKCSVLPLN